MKTERKDDAPPDGSRRLSVTMNAQRSEVKPVQSEGLEVFPESDGYVVHQPKRNKVHFLNNTAVFVLELCNGRHSIGEIGNILASSFEMTKPPSEVVAKILGQFVEEDLVRIP
jgi:hypothetical protein